MKVVTGNLTTCGNVATGMSVAAQHALTIFLIAHLAQKQKTEHTEVYIVTVYSKNQSEDLFKIIYKNQKKIRNLPMS